MTMTSYPKVGGTTTDAQYAELFDHVIGTGVRDSAALAVTADSSGLNVKVAAGFAVVNGVAFNSTAVEPLTIAANTSGNPRIDTIVLRRDPSAGSIVTLVVKQGSPGATPAPVTLTQSTTGVWEEALADVAVANNAATITSANVSDRRRYLSSRVRAWATATRPSGRLGQLGLNTTTARWEYHDGSTWKDLTPTITAAMITDPENLSVGRINGSKVFIQSAQPTGAATNDLWFW